MKKLQIEIPLILPEVPDEKDQCVQRLIDSLQEREGLEKVHISSERKDGVPQLCFHYDQDVVSIEKVRRLAEQAGASLTDEVGHKLIEVDGIRRPRQARRLERALRKAEGVLEASVSATGMVRLEFDATETEPESLLAWLRNEGLQIADTGVPAAEYLRKVRRKKKREPAGEGHEHGGLPGENTELIFSILCGALLGIGFGLSFVEAVPSGVSLALYIGAYFSGGFYTAKEAIQTVAKGGFEIDFLMLVAAIGAAVLGAWAEGALLLFLFSLGHALEHYAMNRARQSIEALADLAPKTALRKKDGQTEEVGIEQLNTGDVIVVKPNSKISADGVVIQGQSSVNQAPITGESMPVDKKPVPDPDQDYTGKKNVKDEHRVFSGTINGNHTLEIQVTKKAEDSTLSRLVQLVKEAETQKSPTQRFTDRFEKYFVPSVLAVALLLNFAFLVIDEPFRDSFYRSMAVLVAASPCALAISTPSAVLSGVARAARGGVLIKGGRPLEDLGELTAIAFDKTGTLTEGEPHITQVITFNHMTEQKLLKTVIAVESLSDHPLAAAIVRDGKKRLDQPGLPDAGSLEAMHGKGVKAELNGSEVYIGNRKLFEELDQHQPSSEILEQVKKLEAEGQTTMLVRQKTDYIGMIALMDRPREEAAPTLEKLKKAGIRRMIMLTGDNQKVADAVGQKIGLTDAWGDLLPEDKVEAIKKLRAEESMVAMVGDGVNDAPAMAQSTVGIAMGAAGSDVALETADIALMSDKLENLPFAIGLSRRSKAIIKQNLWISLGMVAVLIPLTVSGVATIGPAVLLHEGSTLVVVLNALRLLAYRK